MAFNIFEFYQASHKFVFVYQTKRRSICDSPPESRLSRLALIAISVMILGLILRTLLRHFNGPSKCRRLALLSKPTNFNWQLPARYLSNSRHSIDQSDQVKQFKNYQIYSHEWTSMKSRSSQALRTLCKLRSLDFAIDRAIFREEASSYKNLLIRFSEKNCPIRIFLEDSHKTSQENSQKDRRI